MHNGFDGKMFIIIQNLYKIVKSCVRKDSICSDYFSSNIGLRQGENLSPVLFSFFWWPHRVFVSCIQLFVIFHIIFLKWWYWSIFKVVFTSVCWWHCYICRLCKLLLLKPFMTLYMNLMLLMFFIPNG